MNTIRFALVVTAAVVAVAAPVRAQSASSLDAVVQRLDQLERQNAELRVQLDLLRQELGRVTEVAPASAPEAVERVDALEEKVDLHDARISEQDQVKTQRSLPCLFA